MGKKILLADDSLTIQKVVELTLFGTDYELTCVSNGQRALEQVSRARPDLILADVVMPEKNGYEVCEAVKSNPTTARIPLVLLSGTFEPFDRERAERIGCDLVVSKPFDAQQLLEQIETLLSREAETPSAPPPPDEAPFATAFLDDTGQAAPETAVADFESPFHLGYEGVPAAPGTAAASEAASEATSLHAAAAGSGLAIQEPPSPILQPPAEAPAAPPRAAPIELAIEEISAEDAEILFDRAAPEQAGSAPTEPLPAGQLTEEQIERIATRVVEKLSDRVVREIAWEVVPDVAEIAVKRRIEELESGAE